MREGDDAFAPTRPAAGDVLGERGSDDASVGTAVNTRFVPRPERRETPLWPDDRVVVFAAIVGG